MPQVRAANERRLAKADDPGWVQAMVKLVYWQALETGVAYFRWFDTGDLQSVEMLERIAEVARQTPEIRHWLPTRENVMVEGFLATHDLPLNLVIRLSARLVDQSGPDLGLPTSTVHSSSDGVGGFACRAYTSTPGRCGGCRACWSPEVENVSYPLH